MQTLHSHLGPYKMISRCSLGVQLRPTRIHDLSCSIGAGRLNLLQRLSSVTDISIKVNLHCHHLTQRPVDDEKEVWQQICPEGDNDAVSHRPMSLM